MAHNSSKRRIIMKRMLMAITILALSTVLLTNAEAGDRRVGGIILGGGTGAIVGQAIGHNVESTIIGATVGSVAGLLIGNEIQRHHGPVYHPVQTTVYSKSYGDRRYKKIYHPAYRGYRDTCRKFVTIQNGPHQTKRVVTTICNNNYRNHNKDRFRSRF